MKIIVRTDDLPAICFECGALLMLVHKYDPNSDDYDPKKDRMEPASRYWNEGKYISFCGSQHSLDNYERDRNVKT